MNRPKNSVRTAAIRCRADMFHLVQLVDTVKDGAGVSVDERAAMDEMATIATDLYARYKDLVDRILPDAP